MVGGSFFDAGQSCSKHAFRLLLTSKTAIPVQNMARSRPCSSSLPASLAVFRRTPAYGLSSHHHSMANSFPRHSNSFLGILWILLWCLCRSIRQSFTSFFLANFLILEGVWLQGPFQQDRMGTSSSSAASSTTVRSSMQAVRMQIDNG